MTRHYPVVSMSFILACGGGSSEKSEDTAAAVEDTGTEDSDPEDTGEPSDPTETCNGKDDDGDGAVDEGMFGLFWDRTAFAAWQVRPSVAEVLEKTDEWSNGDTDIESVALYDLDGLILTIEAVTSEGDTHTTNYRRGEGGNLTQVQYISNDWMYQTTDYTWDGDRLTSSSSTSLAEDGTGTLMYAIVYTYDGDGYQITQEEDSNGDGEVNNIMYSSWSGDRLIRTDDYYVVRLASYYQIIRTTYSASGDAISKETDADADGTFDQMQTWVYDDNGWLTEILYTGPDGSPTSYDTLEYDSEGRLLWMNVGVEETGEFLDSAGYLWDGDAVLERRERSSTEDVQTTWRFTLDPAGNTAVGIEDPDDLTDGGTHTYTYSFTCH